MKKVIPKVYPIVSLGRLIFFSSENNVQGESNNFMKNFMHLPNLCIYQFLLYFRLHVSECTRTTHYGTAVTLDSSTSGPPVVDGRQPDGHQERARRHPSLVHAGSCGLWLPGVRRRLWLPRT